MKRNQVISFVLLALLGVMLLLQPGSTQTYNRGQSIVAAEYFVGEDPGEGNGTPINGNFNLYDVTVNFDVNVPEGSVIYVRFKSSNGTWSAPMAYVYTKPVPTRGAYLTKAEYFINTDPGIGNGTPIQVDAAGNLKPFTINNLNPGDRVYVRVMDSYERWSAPAQRVYVYPPPNRGSIIVAGEYFINTDPGEGNGIPIEVSALGTVTIDSLDLQRGDRIYIRYKDSYNRWGPAYWFEYKYHDIIAGEYRLQYKNGTLSPIKELEMEAHNDPTLAFFKALSKDTLFPTTTNQVDTILVRFKTDYILGNWYKFAYAEIPITGIASNENLPRKFELYQNYPNPFNPTTTIQYDVPQAGLVTIEIYNLLGQKVRTLVNSHKLPGRYSVLWDAKNDNGEWVAAGMYFCQMRAKNFRKSLKLILVK